MLGGLQRVHSDKVSINHIKCVIDYNFGKYFIAIAQEIS